MEFTFMGWGDFGVAGESEPVDGAGGNIFRVGTNVFKEIVDYTLAYTLDS
jgi:hypothetical protein